MPRDPRVQAQLDSVALQWSTFSDDTKASCYACYTLYLTPFFNSIGNCFGACFQCGGGRRHGTHSRTRGRSEFPFNFYHDDFEDEDLDDYDSHGDFLAWSNDELDRLLAGSSVSAAAGRGSEGYGGLNSGNRPRRKTAVPPHDGGPDPTVIPNTTVFGFWGRLPFKRSTLRYKPSAADLQENPGRHDHPRNGEDNADGKRRPRSSTTSSGQTTDSFRSRGDLFPSEDEDDAIVIGDEDLGVAIGLQRNNSDDLYGKRRGKRRAGRSDSKSTRSTSSGERTKSPRTSAASDAYVIENQGGLESDTKSRRGPLAEPKTDAELKLEEEQTQQLEEGEIRRRREAAQRLARKKGITSTEGSTPDMSPVASASSLHPPPLSIRPITMQKTISASSFSSQSSVAPPSSESSPPKPLFLNQGVVLNPSTNIARRSAETSKIPKNSTSITQFPSSLEDDILPAKSVSDLSVTLKPVSLPRSSSPQPLSSHIQSPPSILLPSKTSPTSSRPPALRSQSMRGLAQGTSGIWSRLETLYGAPAVSSNQEAESSGSSRRPRASSITVPPEDDETGSTTPTQAQIGDFSRWAPDAQSIDEGSLSSSLA